MNQSCGRQPGYREDREIRVLTFLVGLICILLLTATAKAAGRYDYRAVQKIPQTKADLAARQIQRTWPKFVPVVEAALPEDVRLPRVQPVKWVDAYAETGMTFLEYVTSDPNRPSTLRRTIYLQPLGHFSDSKTLELLQEFVSGYFQLPVRILPAKQLDRSCYNPSRKQYDGDELLLRLQTAIPRDTFVCTAICEEDLFSGRLSSVYGLSYNDLRTSVVSTSRIWQNPRYSRETSEQLRLAKLIVHEICHNLGLCHCAAHSCRMNGTMGLRDLERAPVTLCGPCLKKLQWNIGFDNTRRYQALAVALKDMKRPREAMVMRTRVSRRLAQRRIIRRPRVIMAARTESEDLLNEF